MGAGGGGTPRGIARFDSAAGMARALGRFLHGRFATFARFHHGVAALGPVREAPPPLAPARFEALLREHAAAHGVEVTERRPAPAAIGG